MAPRMKQRVANKLILWDGEIVVRAQIADDIKHTKWGELSITIIIPPDQVEDAIEIRKLIGLPILFKASLWEGFKDWIEGQDPDGER